MTKARYMDKRFGIAERVNRATWNVRGLEHKEDELENESKRIYCISYNCPFSFDFGP
jgi:hypothetical protein